MKIDDFILVDSWNWNFEPEPFEGCEIQCPQCKEWSSHIKWEEGEICCTDCGTHTAMICPRCGERFDHVWSPLFKVRNKVVEK